MHAPQIRFLARGFLSALIALLLASGCGGVDSGGTGAVSIGPIAGFGSIIVNGVRFDERSAAIEDEDGAPLSRDRLLLGVMTQIDASASSGPPASLQAIARSVRVSSELVGPVSAVDPAAGSVTVLGQTVLVTPATVFDASLAGGLMSLPTGITVEVYGRYDAAKARYTATRIEARPNPVYYKLRGPIAAVDRAAGTLTIGGQTIDYSRIPLVDVPNVVVGNIVRAKLQPAPVSGVWLAIALPSGVPPLPDRDAATLEGRISEWTSTRQFSVDGIRVDASAAGFPDGEVGVVLGARVSVEGSSSAGVLHARSVEFEGDEDAGNSLFELHGAIDTIDVVAKTFRLDGLTVDYSGPVQYQSGTAADLAVGRRVDVSGTLSSYGTSIKAQRIAFEAP
jgi:hypothetical protein